MLQVIKKDGTLEEFNNEKIIAAVSKSAERVLAKFTDDDIKSICDFVDNEMVKLNKDKFHITEMHSIVESALDSVNPKVAKSYRDYRNYKQDFIGMLDEVYKKSQAIMYIGDKENSNTDSTLVSTKRSLVFNQLNKELYQKFFMTVEELQECRDGYIYIHDMSARRDTMNCCIFDVESVLSGGFEMGNIWYNEPNSLDTAFDVIGDIVLSAASQQYGGFTLPEIDKLLEPYAVKSYNKYYDEFNNISKVLNYNGEEFVNENADKYAKDKVRREFEQGFQGWEYKFNTIASSRGDYPFITITSGLNTTEFGKMCNIVMLRVRKGGQGKSWCKKAVLFPKIVFLYDENLHGEGKELEDVFNEGIECSRKTMYPKPIGA
jgi:anaerobic ribonucleoside-triphosphate reductase